jgi:gas vesicle protein
MIRELREENEKLKKVLIQMAQGGPINLKELGVNDLSELIETMDENTKAMDDMQKPWTEKLKEEKEQVESKPVNKEDRRVPHLTNLNEDPQLTGKVYYSLVDCKLPNFHNL